MVLLFDHLGQGWRLGDAAGVPAGTAELWEVFCTAVHSFRKLRSTELQGWLLDDGASLLFLLLFCFLFLYVYSSTVSKKKALVCLNPLPGASRACITDESPRLWPYETLAAQYQQKICIATASEEGSKVPDSASWMKILSCD